MFGFLRKRGTAREAPPVLVPADAIRPGEDDGALVRALSDYVDVMQRDGGRAHAELDPGAVLAYAADRYLSMVARGGHAACVAHPVTPGLRKAAQEALDTIAPGAFAEIHSAFMDMLAGGKPASGSLGLTAEQVEALTALDAAFDEAGGRDAIDPLIAGWIARLDGLEVVADADYAGRMVALCAEGAEDGAEHRRDLRIAELMRTVGLPLEAGTAIILARAAGKVGPITLSPDGVGARDDGQTATEWHVATGDADFRAIDYSDRLVVFREKPDGSGFAGVGNLGHDRIRLACGWAQSGHVALAAWLGLEKLGVADRLKTIVFDRRKQMKKSKAEAAAFTLDLDDMRNLALVVFPKVAAVVDPRTNERLAEFDYATLRKEAEAHAARLSGLER